MIGRHAVPLASLMWSFGVIALVLRGYSEARAVYCDESIAFWG